jgi:hypothetical protein
MRLIAVKRVEHKRPMTAIPPVVPVEIPKSSWMR